MSIQPQVELLSPAGSLKAMRFAFAYGADAVYAGQPRYSLRVRENEFNNEKLASAIEEAHQQGKSFFVASNIAAHNDKVRSYLRDLEPVIAAKPDALIMSDPGLIMMVREKWPDMPIHLSVQSNVVNYASVKFWENYGISRVILSRELSLKEVAQIRQECPNIELETFVHGALCMAYSGRCLLSGYFNHRDSNQGACTNSCRWKYKVEETNVDSWGNISPKQNCCSAPKDASSDVIAAVAPDKIKQIARTKTYMVEEKNRPGEFIPIQEDESGTYIFNSKDLRAVQHVPKLIQMGINCLKIEGRTKTYFYAARTAQIYRKAIDDALANKPFDMSLMDKLEALSTRGYTEGFYRRHVHDEYQNYQARKPTQSSQQSFIAEIEDYDPKTGMAQLLAKNKFFANDKVELMLPSGNKTFNLESIEDLSGKSMNEVPGGSYRVKVPLNIESPSDVVKMGLLIRHAG
jgi:U32 family peptidase